MKKKLLYIFSCFFLIKNVPLQARGYKKAIRKCNLNKDGANLLEKNKPGLDKEKAVKKYDFKKDGKTKSAVSLVFKSFQKKTESLEFNFCQTTYKSLRGNFFTTSGRGYFRKGKDHLKLSGEEKKVSFRWELDKPDEQWIFHEDKLFHYFPQQNYADKYPVKSPVFGELIALVNVFLDVDELLKKYKAAGIINNREILLKPLELGSGIQEIQLSFSGVKTELSLDKMQISYKGGNYTLYQFENQKTGITPKSKFKLSNDVRQKKNF